MGMLVDLSHVSKKAMQDGLEASKAPVIFSHSSAYSVCNNTRNVQDDVLQMVAKNGGVVMINFYNTYISCGVTATLAEVAGYNITLEFFKNICYLIHCYFYRSC